MRAWRVCLTWGISWSEFWSLSADDEDALMTAAKQLENERRNAQRQARKRGR